MNLPCIQHRENLGQVQGQWCNDCVPNIRSLFLFSLWNRGSIRRTGFDVKWTTNCHQYYECLSCRIKFSLWKGRNLVLTIAKSTTSFFRTYIEKVYLLKRLGKVFMNSSDTSIGVKNPVGFNIISYCFIAQSTSRSLVDIDNRKTRK